MSKMSIDSPPTRSSNSSVSPHSANPLSNIFDICIIGAGVVGSAIARELSRYKGSIVVLERAEDVCTGTSKANSGIVHAGFDAKPGTLMAKFNVEGARRMLSVCKELDVPYSNNGSLVLNFDVASTDALMALKTQGEQNGVQHLEVVDAEHLQELEPHVSRDAVNALWAPTAGIVDPFLLTVGFAENAADNGAAFCFQANVCDISLPSADDSNDDLFTVSYMDTKYDSNEKQTLKARVVVNAAGVYAGQIHNSVLAHIEDQNKMRQKPIKVAPAFNRRLEIIARRGSYLLLDMNANPKPQHTLFQLPTRLGKGILVTPTAHGNTLIGPTAVDIDDYEGTETSSAEIQDVIAKANKSFPDINLSSVITSFAGLRAHEKNHEFLVGMMSDGYFEAAGIESPGLTSAPAIGASLASEIADYLDLEQNPSFKPERTGIVRFADKTPEEKARLIANNPAYGQIICRCETVTEAEIVEATHRSIPVTTLDGIKRRVRAGMGRCQAGFCMPRVMEILARENHISLEDVHKNGPQSAVLFHKTKGGTR